MAFAFRLAPGGRKAKSNLACPIFLPYVTNQVHFLTSCSGMTKEWTVVRRVPSKVPPIGNQEWAKHIF